MPRDVYEESAERRKRLIEELAACKCTYPIVKYRNMSGHHKDCPADALWRQFNLTEKGSPR